MNCTLGMYQWKVREINCEKYLKLYEDTVYRIWLYMFWFYIWFLGTKSCEWRVNCYWVVGIKVTPKPLLLQTPVHYIHVFKSKCPIWFIHSLYCPGLQHVFNHNYNLGKPFWHDTWEYTKTAVLLKYGIMCICFYCVFDDTAVLVWNMLPCTAEFRHFSPLLYCPWCSMLLFTVLMQHRYSDMKIILFLNRVCF
jgi:hypothetical protein